MPPDAWHCAGVWRCAPRGDGGRTLVVLPIVCGVKIPGISQLPLPLPQGWAPTVGVITREYGTSHSGSSDADERHVEELIGTTCTVLMGYAEGPTARSAPRRICVPVSNVWNYGVPARQLCRLVLWSLYGGCSGKSVWRSVCRRNSAVSGPVLAATNFARNSLAAVSKIEL